MPSSSSAIDCTNINNLDPKCGPISLPTNSSVTINGGSSIVINGDFTTTPSTDITFEVNNGTDHGTVRINGNVVAAGTITLALDQSFYAVDGTTSITLFTFNSISGTWDVKVTTRTMKRQASSSRVCTPVKKQTATSFGIDIVCAEPASAPLASSPVLSGGAIAGIVIGGAAFLFIIFLLAILLIRRGRKKSLDQEKGNDIQMTEHKPAPSEKKASPAIVPLKPIDTSDDESSSSEEESKTSQTGTSQTSDSSSGSSSDSDSESASGTNSSSQ